MRRSIPQRLGTEPGYLCTPLPEVPLCEDVTGEPVAIGEELFTDRTGAFKALKRERGLLLLADTIKHPDEIWITFEDVGRGRKKLRPRYVARWLIEGSEIPALAVSEWNMGLWRGVTAFTPDEIANLQNRARIGKKIWSR